MLRDVRWIHCACLGIVALLPRMAHADCMPRSFFDDLDDAARVLVATAPAQASMSSVRMTVDEALKGPRSRSIDFAPSMMDIPTPGEQHLVLLDASDDALGPCSLRQVRGRVGRRLIGAARDWLSQRDPDRRVRQLVRLATSPFVELADPASQRLADDPRYAGRLDPLQIQRLIGVLRRTTDARTARLAALMGRLHALDAVPWLIERMGDPGSNARPMIDALELLANHLTPGYQRGHDVHGEQLARIQTHWRQWYEANRAHADFVVRGWRERSIAPPRTRADRMALVRGGPDRVTRTVSLAGCETSRPDETPISEYLMSPLDDAEWQRLSRRCR